MRWRVVLRLLAALAFVILLPNGLFWLLFSLGVVATALRDIVAWQEPGRAFLEMLTATGLTVLVATLFIALARAASGLAADFRRAKRSRARQPF